MALALTSLAGGVARAADLNPFDTQLQIDVTPYVWAPSINGTFRHPLAGVTGPNGQPVVPAGATFDAQVGPNQILANLNFALMGAIAIHYGDLALYGDFMNLNVSGGGLTKIRNVGATNYTLNGTAGGQIVPTLWTIAPGYRVFHNRYASIDILAGVQTLWLSTNGNATVTGPLGNTFQGGFNQFQSLSTFVAGFNGRVRLGGKFSVPFFYDYGFGQPSSSQWLVGVKYGDRSGISLDWRSLQYDATNANSMLQSLHLSGPLLGYTLSI